MEYAPLNFLASKTKGDVLEIFFIAVSAHINLLFELLSRVSELLLTSPPKLSTFSDIICFQVSDNL